MRFITNPIPLPLHHLAYVAFFPNRDPHFDRNALVWAGTHRQVSARAVRASPHPDHPQSTWTLRGGVRESAAVVLNHEAHMVAYARLYQGLAAQAASLAYIDTFMVLAVVAAIMFCLTFVLKKNDPGGGGEAAVG